MWLSKLVFRSWEYCSWAVLLFHCFLPGGKWHLQSGCKAFESLAVDFPLDIKQQAASGSEGLIHLKLLLIHVDLNIFSCRNTAYEYSVLSQHDADPEEDIHDYSVNLDSLIDDSSSDEDSTTLTKNVNVNQNTVSWKEYFD